MKNICLFGDCRESMRVMIAAGVRVQTCVTSPPYWGLRDYGTATWEGGEAECDHKESGTDRGPRAELPKPPAGWAERSCGKPFGAVCGKCGARRIDSQLGLESTPEEYLANMVEVFRLVRELLADDGTLWLNLGDSYATGGGSVGRAPGGGDQGARFIRRGMINTQPNRMPIPGLKPKDLVGIPWRVAFALQADGWYLRSDIIWAKPNPMPESVTDRPTKAHEYLFLLSKRERYFYDADAIREAVLEVNNKPPEEGNAANASLGHGVRRFADTTARRNVSNPLGRNRRTVWTVATEPYAEAHFATFPRALIEPCVLAGSRVGDIVFDPFLGSGTTAQVAQDLGRHWLGCELNQGYGDLQYDRTRQQALVLA